jgi:hypothetical protein
MELFQLEERFGKRPVPRLSLYVHPLQMVQSSGYSSGPLRHLLFGLKSEGRGIAKFPDLRFKRSPNLGRDNFGIDGNGGFGIPPRASETAWIVFRGGVDDVIYPGETRLVGKLIQSAVNREEKGIPPMVRPGQVATGFAYFERLFVCEAMTLDYEISAEGAATQAGSYQLAEDSLTIKIPAR